MSTLILFSPWVGKQIAEFWHTFTDGVTKTTRDGKFRHLKRGLSYARIKDVKTVQKC